MRVRIEDPTPRCCTCKGTENLRKRWVSTRVDGTTRQNYICKDCHNPVMRELMRKRYATPEGRLADAEAHKRMYERKRNARMLQVRS